MAICIMIITVLNKKKNHDFDFDRVIGNDDNYPLNYEGDTFSNNTLRIVASNKQDNNVILDRETSRVETEIAKSELTRNVMIFSLSDTATFDLNNSTIKGSTSNLSLFFELRGTDSEGKQHKYEVNVNYGFSSDFTEINQVQNIIF